MHESSGCRFCELANGSIPSFTVYQDGIVTCFLSKDPISPGHTLIVPKAPFLDLDELDDHTACRIMRVSQLIARALKTAYRPDGISIMQNGGAFNDVGHYHMHVFCRFKGDGFSWVFSDDNHDKYYSRAVQEQVREAISSLASGLEKS